MPVLSPHRSTPSGNYRSYSSSIERPYFSSSYSPRISSYSERFSTRSYTDSEGRRIFSRSGSITEDGVTTRFREETREGSVRRDSISRDSGISSIRESSVLDYPRRDSSLSRESSRLSTMNVIDSVAELRNKYSPANYVPSCHRKNENISRSKSINDIGLPPIESKPATKKKVTDSLNYNNSIGLNSNNTNNENVDVEDDNGNRTSVADLRKKFDEKPLKSQKSSSPPIDTPSQKVSDNIFKKQDVQESTNNKMNKNDVKLQNGDTKNKKNEPRKILKNEVKSEPPKNTTKRTQEVVNKTGSKTSLNEASTDKSSSSLLLNGEIKPSTDKEKLVNGLDTTSEEKNNIKDGVDEVDSRQFVNGDKTELVDESVKGDASQKTSRVNNYASFYPVKNCQKGEDAGSMCNGETTMQCPEDIKSKDGAVKDSADKDLGTSPKLTRSTISPSGSSLSAATSATSSNSIINTNSLPRRSVERERQNSYGGGAVGGKEEESQTRSNHHDRIYDRLYDRTGGGGLAPQTKTLGLNGLKNIGNTCFMNSVIQCLSNTRLLLEYVRKDAYIKDINTTISGMKGALIKAFAEVLKELWSEDSCDRVVNTLSLKSQIQRFAPRFMGYAQQDAQEFLRYLLEGLHEDVNRVTEKPKPILTEIDEKLSDSEKAKESWSRYLRMDNSRIVDIFVGQLKSTLRCTHCGHASVTFDPFWDLSLPIPQRTGQLRLSQCLESFTREETLDGDEKPTCSKCKERRKCTKSFTIQKFPKILVIHLKRFSPTERFRGKLNVTVDFPLEGLDMSNYAADNVAPPRYNLYAVSNHSGTTYSGHYTAYCRHPYTHTWHEYNDSRVSSISPKSIVSSEAYVLFYELDGQKSHL